MTTPEKPKFDVDAYVATHNPEDKGIFWVAAFFLIILPVAVFLTSGYGCK